MSLKPIRYNSGEGRVKIRIEEPDGSMLENWTIMMSDLGKWISIMRKKYGSVIDGRKDQDLDWLR